jgi:hypothetical protein
LRTESGVRLRMLRKAEEELGKEDEKKNVRLRKQEERRI